MKYCPKWQMTLTSEIGQLTTQNAVVHFHISAPQWGKELFECSAAIGERKGGDDALSHGSLTALLYQVGDDFEIR